MVPALLVLSAALPVFVFMFLVYRKDTEKEPPKLLILCFVFGCISVLPILVVEMFLSDIASFNDPALGAFYHAFVVAAFTEEVFKFLVLYLIIWKRKEFDQYYDGIVYAVFVSLGFAFVENILYVVQSGFTVALMRAVLSIPGHGFFGVAMGYFFALARFTPQKRTKLLWMSLLVPILLHGLYDFFLFFVEGITNPVIIVVILVCFVVFIVLMWVFGIKRIRRQYKKDLYHIEESKKVQQPTASLYPIQPGSYNRMILLKNTTEEQLVRRITEFGALYWTMHAQMHSFKIGRSGEWFVIKVADSVSFYTYHQLVAWLSSNEYAIGFANHKADPACDYIFYLDAARPFRDAEIGVFRNGASFFVFLPEANAVYGNLTLTGAFQLSWNDAIGGLLSNGHDISRNDMLCYTDYTISMGV